MAVRSFGTQKRVVIGFLRGRQKDRMAVQAIREMCKYPHLPPDPEDAQHQVILIFSDTVDPASQSRFVNIHERATFPITESEAPMLKTFCINSSRLPRQSPYSAEEVDQAPKHRMSNSLDMMSTDLIEKDKATDTPMDRASSGIVVNKDGIEDIQATRTRQSEVGQFARPRSSCLSKALRQKGYQADGG